MNILYPVLVQVGLTYFLQLWMGLERLRAVRAGTVQRGANPGVRPTWPVRAGVVSNAFHNQLEMPMLFYAAAAFALLTNAADPVMIALAWGFALLRLVHAFIHTTYNNVAHRFAVYIVSSMVLLAMWVRLGLHVALGS